MPPVGTHPIHRLQPACSESGEYPSLMVYAILAHRPYISSLSHLYAPIRASPGKHISLGPLPSSVPILCGKFTMPKNRLLDNLMPFQILTCPIDPVGVKRLMGLRCFRGGTVTTLPSRVVLSRTIRSCRMGSTGSMKVGMSSVVAHSSQTLTFRPCRSHAWYPPSLAEAQASQRDVSRP